MNKIVLLILGGVAGVMMLILFPFFLLLSGTVVAAVPNPPNTVVLKIQDAVDDANERFDGSVDWQDVQAVMHVRLQADWDEFSDRRLATLLTNWFEEYTVTDCRNVETIHGTAEVCHDETRWRTRSMDEVKELLEMTDEELQWLALVEEARQAANVADGAGCVSNDWQPAPARGWLWPLPGYGWVTSCFGLRIDPVYGGQRFHAGLDVGAPTGARLIAPAPGIVTGVGAEGACGNSVTIKHFNGYSTRYCHLSGAVVLPSQVVEAGQAIGMIGSTGKSTGPHMHVEVMRNGDYINPLVVFDAR